MRDIMFRGKRKDNGEWMYGNLMKIRDHYHINAVNRKGIVDEDTVGQYIGIDDCNGLRIFEGDILLVHGVVGRMVVEYCEICKAFELFDGNKMISFVTADLEEYVFSVMGNIHDNPELLSWGRVVNGSQQ